jgi:hypothetical protein
VFGDVDPGKYPKWRNAVVPAKPWSEVVAEVRRRYRGRTSFMDRRFLEVVENMDRLFRGREFPDVSDHDRERGVGQGFAEGRG